jgi:hypothetical protein
VGATDGLLAMDGLLIIPGNSTYAA